MKESPDLLYGIDAIARHLGITPRQTKHRCATTDLPTFRMGRNVCARRSSLDRWLAEREAAARPDGDGAEPGHERAPEGEDAYPLLPVGPP